MKNSCLVLNTNEVEVTDGWLDQSQKSLQCLSQHAMQCRLLSLFLNVSTIKHQLYSL